MSTPGRRTDAGEDPSGPLRRLAARIADAGALPTSQRAVLGYYAQTGDLDYRALRIKRYVDETLDRILADLFAEVEAALAVELDAANVSFTYETKLTLPAELTLGYLYRRALAFADGVNPVTREADGGLRSFFPRFGGASGERPLARERNRRAVRYVERAEATTELVVAALLDGDMRDALNDEEYGDFEVDVPLDGADRRRVATVAQETLREATERNFEAFPPAVRAAHRRAVDRSETHQDQDEHFRDLLDAVEVDGDDARERIRDEYKFRPFPDDDHPFSAAELDLPYLVTQYDRVGVIYEGMIEMYRGVGFDIPPAFERSIVFSIVGAQVWLDDVDDYRDDVAEGQLTPVTAEYALTGDDATAYRNVADLTATYLGLARTLAAEAESPLTGIAAEYIRRSGDPSVLPGAPAVDR